MESDILLAGRQCVELDMRPQLMQCHWQAEDTIYAILIIAKLGRWQL
jgi:hypothetical protein